MEAAAALPGEHRESLLSRLWFEELYVPASAVPALAAHLRSNARDYAVALAAGDSGVVAYVNVHADRFIDELGAALRAGLIVTIDYGGSTWDLIQGARRGEFPFRVYGAQRDFVPRPNDPYAMPGTQDMTADVNFTALSRAGCAAGLLDYHYGHERDLAGDDLPALLEAAGDEATAEFLGNPVFKALVLGKEARNPFGNPLFMELPLTHARPEVPPSRRGLIPAIERRLAGISPGSQGRARK
jgi:hypothetical protein